MWRQLATKLGTSKHGESNGKLPLRTCPGCSVPEPYRSPDWALVPAQIAQGLNTTTNNKNEARKIFEAINAYIHIYRHELLNFINKFALKPVGNHKKLHYSNNGDILGPISTVCKAHTIGLK